MYIFRFSGDIYFKNETFKGGDATPGSQCGSRGGSSRGALFLFFCNEGFLRTFQGRFANVYNVSQLSPPTDEILDPPLELVVSSDVIITFLWQLASLCGGVNHNNACPVVKHPGGIKCDC